MVAALWGVFIGFGPEFAVVFAAVLALNGQEWYHDRFGTEGRLGAGWTFWSTGGRLVTLAALFVCVSLAITGYAQGRGRPAVRLRVRPQRVPLRGRRVPGRRDDIKGNVLNTTAARAMP